MASGRVRHLAQSDIPRVAGMYCQVFLGETPPLRSIATVQQAFIEVFFQNPWYDEQISSLVYLDSSGDIAAFLGITPRPMQFRQQRIRGAVSVHFMTVPGTKGQLAGLQLLGAFFKGPQDFSLTDGANQLGRKVWEGLGGVTVPGYSFHWKRVLRPTALALERVARKVPLGSAVQSVLRPFSGLGDRYLARVMPYRYSIAPVPLDTANLTLEALHDNVRECSADDSLRPDYDIAGLGWLLDRAARIRQSGDLQTACVLERGDRLGWYMYYLRPGGESRVLQVGARRHAFHQVFDHMCRHAWERGAIALTGRIEPKYVAVLAERQCSFSGGDPWLQIQSRDKDLLQTILSGDAFLTDLEGEWCTSFRGT